jgi:transcriptional regulator with XRE-family HTH domain
MTDRRTFGQAVREARLAKGMSMGQLAAAVERSTASVRRWERDQGVPTETVVQELIVVLNLDEAETQALAAAPPPIAPPTPQPDEEPSQATRATSASMTNTASTTVQPSSGRDGLLSSLRDPEKPWLGYLRAALTVIILLVLAWVLIWALRGFLVAFGDVWESVWVEAP